jgi:uncharacterized protein YaiL (DUF2058 family)
MANHEEKPDCAAPHGAAALQSHAAILPGHSFIPMRNPLQEQLLKAGLVNKTKAAQVVREQTKQRHSKSPTASATEQVDTQRLQAERAERDRAIAAERNAQTRAGEQRAQVRQIVESHKMKREGEIAYRFTDGEAIKSLLVNEPLRAQLAAGILVIVRHDQGYELLPRIAAEKVYARDDTMIVLDHGRQGESAAESDDDAFYKQFEVPDDLVW